MEDLGPRVPRAVCLPHQHHRPAQAEPRRHRLGQGAGQKERLHRSVVEFTACIAPLTHSILQATFGRQIKHFSQFINVFLTL